MAIIDRIEGLWHELSRAVFSALPRQLPDQDKLAACRLVAHRGLWGCTGVRENTMDAFRRAVEAGLWGLELDVRYTSDAEPVVIHDPDLARVFGKRLKVDATSRSRLKKACPGLPDLEQVVDSFGRRIHLMVEIKTPAGPWAAKRLERVLAGLEPGSDYHVMSLEPGWLDQLSWLTARAKIPIARTRVRPLLDLVSRRGWAGLAGHFLLLKTAHLKWLHSNGFKAGSGFADSANCLWRELSRGVDWIFTNQGGWLQSLTSGISKQG